MTDSTTVNAPFDTPLRVLSLDGGGVRGIASLRILKEIMTAIGGDARPCQYFDLIGGTSAGGLIALMLGRLGWTVDQCIEQFDTFSKRIFSVRGVRVGAQMIRTGARYSGEHLEEAIKDFLLDENKKMGDQERGHRPTFVITVNQDDLHGEPVICRTYHMPDAAPISQAISNSFVSHACRATSAAPYYFPPFQLTPYTFLDGGLGHNNPVLEALHECSELTSSTRPIACLVSIGTGVASNKALALSGSIFNTIAALLSNASAMVSMLTDTEQAHRHVEKMAKKQRIKYFRFNPPGAERIKLDQHKKIEKLKEIAEDYLSEQKTQEKVKRCADILVSQLAPIECCQHHH